MAKLNLKNGVTSVILRVKIMDTASTTGGGKTGLTFSSSGLIISTLADVEASATAYTAAGSTIETITTLGTFAAPTATKCRFKEVDATNHPGLYEIQIANARWAVSGARSIIVTVLGATGAAQVDAELQLEPVPANVTQWSDTAVTTPTTAGSPVVTLPTGAITSTTFAANAIDSAAVAANTIGSSEWAGSAATETADAVLAAMASDTGTATAGAASTITLASSAVATTDYYINQWIWIRSGTGLGQSRRIKSYTSGRVATVDAAWAVNPDATSVYYVFPSGRVDLGTVLGTSISPLVSGRVDASVGALAAGAITAASIATDAIDADALAADASSELVAAIVAAIADTDDVAAAIWNYLTSAATTAGSLGKLLVDNVNTSLATLATQASLTAVKAKTDQLAFTTANRVDSQLFGTQASAITATSLATDTLTAAKIAADAIGASELAADAVTEIATAVGTSIAVAVWDRLTSALTTTGSIGKLLTDNLSATSPTTLQAIKAKTDSLTFTTALRVDSQVFGIQGSAITAAAIAADAIGASELAADAATEIATAVRTTLGMATNNLDTQLAALQADTDNLQTRLPAALTGQGNIKADMVAVNDDINVVNLFQAALGIEKIGTVASGTVTSSAFSTNLTDTEANTWHRRTVAFISGTLKYQVRPITTYDATTKVITVDEAFSTAPTIGDQFILI